MKACTLFLSVNMCHWGGFRSLVQQRRGRVLGITCDRSVQILRVSMLLCCGYIRACSREFCELKNMLLKNREQNKKSQRGLTKALNQIYDI